MKVKIIKSSHWHTGMIGQKFNVKCAGKDGRVEVTDRGFCLGNGLHKYDYEVVPEATTKIVTHEGVSYEVPAYATCLTRDSVGKDAYYWENTPAWSSDLGYWPSSGLHGELFGIAQVCVPPKPDGHFIVAI